MSLLLGLDIGGTKALAALGRDGAIVGERLVAPWPSGNAAADLAAMLAALRALLEEKGASPGQVSGLGVSAPGPLDPVAGVVGHTPNLEGWDGFPLKDRLEAELGVPAVLENDANAAALAEWRYGAGRGAESVVYLTMSTGIGCGMVLDGRLYRGAHFQAGEFGHIPLIADGRLCACGMRGCLEAYVSGAGIAARIREDLARGERISIEPASARGWAAAVRAGDPYALRLREEWLGHLSQGLAMLIMTLDPERVLLGTIVARNPDLFLDEIRERVRARIWGPLRGVEIECAALGERLPAYAALSVAELAARS